MSRPPQPSPNDLMRFRTFIAAGLAALASACAGHPDSSAPTYVPPSTFENLTCRQLGEEQKRITRAEATGGRLDGKPGDADDMALLKGAMEALEQVSIDTNCNIEFQHGCRGPRSAPLRSRPPLGSSTRRIAGHFSRLSAQPLRHLMAVRLASAARLR